jgi:Protein of unknown function (DUF2867)
MASGESVGNLWGRGRARWRWSGVCPGLPWVVVLVLGMGALFHPHGLLGHVYWWLISPFHGVVFRGMKRNIAQAAETEANRTRTRPRRAHPVGAPPDSVAWVGAFVRPR